MSNIAEKVVKHAIMTLYKQSGLISLVYDVIAQSVERWTVNRKVDGSIPDLTLTLAVSSVR